jgi:ferredoxin
MKTRLYVYTGTGNSLWVARQLAAKLKKATIDFMPYPRKAFKAQAEAVGIIFPVHIWGLPGRVIQFVNHLKVKSGAFLFAVAVNASQPAATLIQLQRLMASRGLSLSLGFSIVLPSNYIPWGGPGQLDAQQKRFQEARKKVGTIAGAVLRQERHKVEKGPLWQNILFSLLYKLSFRQVPQMDKKFWADEKCNSCRICSKVCPAANIEMNEGKPGWLHGCEQCFACLQWCPQEAIQYGEKTVRHQRYHHPVVILKDMLEQAQTWRFS